MASSGTGQPNAKEKKYDRQLRLWGANGQQALEASHICLVNATATGCEVLKNLILPGIGKFTVIDDATIAEVDLGVNFFVDAEGVGLPRAEYTCKYLSELNPDVQGSYINDSLSNLITSDPTFISTHGITAIILCSPLPSHLVHTLQVMNPDLAIFHVYCVGFISSLRIFLPELRIVETHPDSLIDLRLFNPWVELLLFAKNATRDMNTMSEHQHGHIPYLAILLHYLEKWKEEHGERLPGTYKEKNEFKKLLLTGMRTDVAGGIEENWEEAAAAVLANVKPHEISSGIREVLEDDRCQNLDQDSDNFWIIARGIAEFVASPDQGDGLLPLPGGIPDMKTESRDYVKLQNLYRQKAASDLAQVAQNVSQILVSLNRPETDIPEEDISLWCKNANHVRRIRYRPFIDEWMVDTFHAKVVYSDLKYNPDTLLPIYIALRAYQTFYDDYGHDPGQENGEDDSPELLTHARVYLRKVADLLELPENEEFPSTEILRALDMWCREVTRYGGAELQNIASLTGGIVSQEVLKCVTRQYLPVRNTVVLDGVQSKSAVWEL
ncbi:hypothetical protein BGX38DRAFT_1184591 [Terfezia claveryi]|nr:hypothetical protein BGX38DRAFT_1184591 [Terfezia claveryi]